MTASTAFVVTSILVLLSIIVVLMWMNYRLLQQAQQSRNEFQRLQSDMTALCAAAVAVDQHISELDQGMRRVMERQDQLDLKQPATQIYSQAIRLAQKGANANDLVSTCGLAQGEAELLQRLYTHHS